MKATTVEAYLAELPQERKSSLETVRNVILANLDSDFDEGMQYGMIGYFVPHRIYPAGYHCDPSQPVPFVGLASHKDYMSVYLMCVYGNEKLANWFQAEWSKTGKKLDMGKSCIRFKTTEDLALEVIAEAIRRVPARKFIEFYESAMATRKNPARKPVSRTKAARKK